MDNEFWLICMQCGFTKKIRKEDIVDDDDDFCDICGGHLVVDCNKGKNITHKSSEITREMIKEYLDYNGSQKTWEMIEATKDPKIRIKIRKIFFDLDGKIPE